MLQNLIEHLIAQHPLSSEQIAAAVVGLVNSEIGVDLKADFLTALAQKGETVDEISGFAGELRKLSVQPPVSAEIRSREILDVCGTGGDRLNTFNISTTVALVAAAAGVLVAKHGNRAITSQSGSADVLEELGVPINLTPEQAMIALESHNFAFFLAANYHPAFKHIGPARRLCAEKGQRTIFNFLGPLLNPVRPSAQLLGVARADLCEPVAGVLQALGVRRAMVVSGDAGEGRWLDELSTLGETTIAEFYQSRAMASSRMNPADFFLNPARLEDLAGGDRKQNAQIIRVILSGEERGAKRDAVLLNAGAALFVAATTKSISEGMELAAELIDSGVVSRKLTEICNG